MPRAQNKVFAAVMAVATTAFAHLYVSPDGNDTAPGTRAQPFATIVRTRDAVRQLRKQGAVPAKGLTVWLRGGTYVLDNTLAFTAEDSGTPDGPIVYRVVDGEDVWLSGGTAVPSELFRPVTDPAVLKLLPQEARWHVLQVSLAEAGVTDYEKKLPDCFSGFTRVDKQFVYVYCNGRQMQWARWPNEGFAKFAEIIDPGSGLRDYVARRAKRFRPGVFSYEGDRPSRWDVDRGVWMMGFWARAYVCDVVRAGKIDTEKKHITWAVPLTFGLDTWGANRWYAFNLIEELDIPGEWYIDREKGVLYFWPPSAPSPAAERSVVLSRLKEPMVSFTGANHVTFRGIGFEGGRGDAIVVRKGRDVELVSCEVRNVGRHAVQLLGGYDHKVIGCDIHHVGYGGVIMSGGNRRTLEPANHEAINNHVYHTNQIRRTHASPFKLHGVGLRMAHNLVHHAPHSAVFYGGNDIVMEYNDIYWCHYETAEGGVFYAGYNWTYRGNVIGHNYIHHINDSLDGSPTGVNVVHLDDCVAGTDFSNNVVYRVGRGVSMCGGPWNVAHNNIFIDCQVGVSLSTRGLQWWTWTRHPDGTVTARDKRASHGYSTNNGLLRKLKQVPWDREPYTKYANMANLLKVDPIAAPWWCEITRNIAIGGPLMRVSKRVKPEWVTIEDNWDAADRGDPGIVAPYDGNYALKPNAPALKTGFKPIPFRKIGLIDDDTRRSWPVKMELPPKDWKPCWLRRREMERKMPAGLPVVPVRRLGATITIDGTVDPEEWTPGEKQTVSVNRYEPIKLIWRAVGEKATYPSTAYLEVDDANLYAAFINDVEPKGGIVGGHTWGQSDAVEVALAVVEDNEPGPIMLWRGYTDGHFESSNEAGAPQKVVKRVLQGAQYACHTVSKTRWTAEWKIPFAAIGIAPRELNPRILFSLAVRKVSGNEWVTWKKAPGASWDVRKSGVLWLEPFGDITFNGAVPSRIRCEIFPRTKGLLIDGGKNCEALTWAKPVGTRLRAASEELTTGKWKEFVFEFTPRADGQVLIELRGRPHQSTIKKNTYLPVWNYWDDLRLEGAELLNGGFEGLDPKTGLPKGWGRGGNAILVTDPKAAASGRGCVKTWFLGRFMQTIQVKKGTKVTVRAKVRGEMPD